MSRRIIAAVASAVLTASVTAYAKGPAGAEADPNGRPKPEPKAKAKARPETARCSRSAPGSSSRRARAKGPRSRNRPESASRRSSARRPRSRNSRSSSNRGSSRTAPTGPMPSFAVRDGCGLQRRRHAAATLLLSLELAEREEQHQRADHRADDARRLPCAVKASNWPPQPATNAPPMPRRMS